MINERLLAYLVIFMLLLCTVDGVNIQVEKIVDDRDYSVGDDLGIMLNVTNPFDQDVTVRIVDKNILASNGYEVECLERVIPAEQEMSILYDPISLYSAGKFTLDKAEITYNDPDSGKEISVDSDKVNVVVGEGNSSRQGTQQGVTTIYDCDGQKMRSTSFSSSGSSFSFTMNSGGSQATQQQANQQSQEEMQRQQEQQQQQQQQLQNKLQNNQMSQDANVLKQQMQKQFDEQNKMMDQFSKNVAAKQEVQQKHNDLLQQGYNMTGLEVDPTANDTGNFKAQYSLPDGTTAQMTGSLANNTLQNLTVNKFNQTGQNMTEQPKIEKQKPKRDPLLLAITILLLLAALLLYMKKKRRALEAEEEQASKKRFNYRSYCRRLIEKAKKSFENGEQKESYFMISDSVRTFVSHMLGVRTEMTSTAILAALKKHGRFDKKTQDHIRKCLNICGMVEFAKYEPNRKDFDEIVSIAQTLVK